MRNIIENDESTCFYFHSKQCNTPKEYRGTRTAIKQYNAFATVCSTLCVLEKNRQFDWLTCLNIINVPSYVIYVITFLPFFFLYPCKSSSYNETLTKPNELHEIKRFITLLWCSRGLHSQCGFLFKCEYIINV